ncbi:hypothetical protein AVEN_216960-1 [Araneus ventricosus]|uniref:Transcriptional coactivator p15 (PC4) C-terminal domain-containing protein n=1 Tax=Araneus ventricosus TaxID=182803 RepID=A0A4Y2EDN8_ARAVE|nr:hypothetical protein AVEN_216960-1 [Araneus ventricosus]
MKRTSSEPTTSTAPAKKSSILNNTDSFTAVSDFGKVLNVHIRKLSTNENGRILPTKNGVNFSPFKWQSVERDSQTNRIGKSHRHPPYVVSSQCMDRKHTSSSLP